MFFLNLNFFISLKMTDLSCGRNSTNKSEKKINLDIIQFEVIKDKVDNDSFDFKDIHCRSKSKEKKHNIFETYSTNSFNKSGNFPFLNTNKINFRNEFSKKKRKNDNKENLQRGGICYLYNRNKNSLSSFLKIENNEKENNINFENEKCIPPTPKFTEIFKYNK